MPIERGVFKVVIGSQDLQGGYRLIRRNELSQLLELYVHLNLNDSKPPDAEAYSKTWESISSNPDILYFVADLNGQLIASCHLVLVPNLTRGCRPYGVVENVVTRVEFRSQGIGKGLLKYALHTAWSKGCYKVMLMTGKKEEWVHGFYESAGFKKGVKTAFLAAP